MSQLVSLKRFTTVVAGARDIASIGRFEPREATTNLSLSYHPARQPVYRHLLEDAPRHGERTRSDQRARSGAVMNWPLTNVGRDNQRIAPGRGLTELDVAVSLDVKVATPRPAQGPSTPTVAGAGHPTARA